VVDGPVLVSVGDGPQRPASLQFLRRQHPVLTLDGETREYSVAPVFTGPVTPGWDTPTPGAPTELFLGDGGWSCRLEVLTRESRLARVLAAIEREEGAADPAVRSPMPGTVVSVSVSNGDTVVAGQVLLSVEAMKMEHHLVAEVDGTVHTSARAGDLVKADQVLATIHPEVHPEVHPEAHPEAHPETHPTAHPEAHPEEPAHTGATTHDSLNTGKGA
jgi:acetyl-CoA/propionyl-CoA carboxylase biotin carboxyl carrier protein